MTLDSLFTDYAQYEELMNRSDAFEALCELAGISTKEGERLAGGYDDELGLYEALADA